LIHSLEVSSRLFFCLLSNIEDIIISVYGLQRYFKEY
jgi:hypothetical protein